MCIILPKYIREQFNTYRMTNIKKETIIPIVWELINDSDLSPLAKKILQILLAKSNDLKDSVYITVDEEKEVYTANEINHACAEINEIITGRGPGQLNGVLSGLRYPFQFEIGFGGYDEQGNYDSVLKVKPNGLGSYAKNTFYFRDLRVKPHDCTGVSEKILYGPPVDTWVMLIQNAENLDEVVQEVVSMMEEYFSEDIPVVQDIVLKVRTAVSNHPENTKQQYVELFQPLLERTKCDNVVLF